MLLAFSRRNLELVASAESEVIGDAHSVVWEPDGLAVVSTYTDSVVRVQLFRDSFGDAREIWRPADSIQPVDVNHLNGLCRVQGRLLVSGFGRRAGQRWDGSETGFITDIETGECVLKGLRQPHSVAEIRGALGYCESGAQRVGLLAIDGERREAVLDGYTRGLCTVGDELFVATSRARSRSRRTGELVPRLADLVGERMPTGRSAIHRIDLATLQTKEIIDLAEYGWEIYDLLPIEHVDRWPLMGEVDWRRRLIGHLRQTAEEAMVAERRLHVEIAARDGTVRAAHEDLARLGSWMEESRRREERLHAEVARRDETITWLHREVATRDATITWLHQEVAARDAAIAQPPGAPDSNIEEPPG
ncbi:MAG: DUF4915 domain-containing protein [Chloroflexota bacterium]